MFENCEQFSHEGACVRLLGRVAPVPRNPGQLEACAETVTVRHKTFLPFRIGKIGYKSFEGVPKVRQIHA